MHEWTAINLTWSQVPTAVEAASDRKRKKASKLYVKSQQKAESQVGQTVEAAKKQLDEVRLANLRLKRPAATQDGLVSLYGQDLTEVNKRYPILDRSVNSTPPDCCDEAWLKEVTRVARRNPVALALAQYRYTKWKVTTLADQQPEAAQARVLEQEASAAVRTSVFYHVCGSHDLCRPGVLIEVQDHKTKEIKQLLIGHIGPYGGDSPAEIGPDPVDKNDVVLRAKVVWVP